MSKKNQHQNDQLCFLTKESLGSSTSGMKDGILYHVPSLVMHRFILMKREQTDLITTLLHHSSSSVRCPQKAPFKHM